jgi:hypothetical protein
MHAVASPMTPASCRTFNKPSPSCRGGLQADNSTANAIQAKNTYAAMVASQCILLHSKSSHEAVQIKAATVK